MKKSVVFHKFRNIIWESHLGDYKSTIIDVMLILLVGLLSITWFRGDFLIDRGDFDLPLNRLRGLMRCFYLWDDNISFGTLNSRITAAIPYNFVFAFSEIIGLSLVTAEKILFYICFTSAGLTMYYLTSALVKSRRIASLLSALFYMMNIYSLTFIWNFSYGSSYAFTYAFFPLIFAFYIKGLDEKKGLRYAILICIIWIATTSAACVSPPFIVLNWAILISYGLFHIIFHWKEKTNVKHALCFTALTVLVWAFLSMYWLIPMSFSALREFTKASLEGFGLSDLFIFKLNSAPLLEALRLTGYWALYANYKGDPYYPWAAPYASSPFLLISFLIPFLAFLPLISRSKSKHVLYFAFLALLGLFLVNGSFPPFEEINLQLFSLPGLLRIFREPIIKFGIIVILAYAFLIGVGVDHLYHYFKRINYPHNAILSKIPLITIVFLLLGVYAWPFWTGDVIYGGGKISASGRIQVPAYYYKAGDYLGGQNEIFRVLPFPFPTIYTVEYMWDHGYSGADPSHWLFPKPVISINTGDVSYEMATSLVKLLHENQNLDIGKTLALLNVKYVLLHRDNNWNYTEGLPWWISTSLEHYLLILSSQKSLSFEKSFGKLDFYRNEYWKPMHLYAASYATLVHGGLNETIDVVESNNSAPDEFALFLSDQLTPEQYLFIANLSSYDLKPNIIVEKINPTKYVIHVDASQPFFLVFSESYDKGWVACTNGEQVPGERHFMANGYANAWFINKTGSYDIVLEFWPQKLFYIGSAISITTLILCTLYISKDKMKTIYKRYTKKRNKKNT